MGTMERKGTSRWSGMLAPTMDLATGASASMKKPGRMPAMRQSAARPNMAVSEKRSASCARLRGFRARAAEKGDAEGLDEAGRGESGGERKQRADRGDEELQAP